MALGARTHTGEASKGSPLSPQSASDRQLRTQNFPQPQVTNANTSPRLARDTSIEKKDKSLVFYLSILVHGIFIQILKGAMAWGFTG